MTDPPEAVAVHASDLLEEIVRVCVPESWQITELMTVGCRIVIVVVMVKVV
jgi:hypothetical protein